MTGKSRDIRKRQKLAQQQSLYKQHTRINTPSDVNSAAKNAIIENRATSKKDTDTRTAVDKKSTTAPAPNRICCPVQIVVVQRTSKGYRASGQITHTRKVHSAHALVNVWYGGKRKEFQEICHRGRDLRIFPLQNN